MSAGQQDMIVSLNEKIQRLMRAYEYVKRERDALQFSLGEQEALVGRLNETITGLEEKNKKLQLADAFKASSGDTRDAKLKIGRIVREIDKCMALLNK